MTAKFGQAGKSARDMAFKRYSIRMFIVFAALLLCWIFVKSMPHLQGAGIGAMLAALILFMLCNSWLESKGEIKRKEEKRAIRGAKGEENVEKTLDQLDENHLVFHDVPSPYGNIDHIVLAKTGLFLIETKAHGGKVSVTGGELLVNGHQPEKDFIRQTLRNSSWLKERILQATGVEPWVNPIIAFSNAFVEWGNPIKGVTVTNRKFLLKKMDRLGKDTSKNSALWDMRQKLSALVQS